MVDFDIQGNPIASSDTVVDCLDDGLELGTRMEPATSRVTLRYEHDRLLTFKHWPSDWGKDLARYGFCSISKDNQGSVRCVFCGLEITDFASPQEAKLKHWQSARQYCRFLQGENVDNVPLDTTHPEVSQKLPATQTIHKEQTHLLRASPEHHNRINGYNDHTHSRTLSPTIHHPETRPEPHTSVQPADLARKPASSSSKHTHGSGCSTNYVHWTEIVRTARYPRMASYPSRLLTLERWPLLKPSPTELAKAGFFHVRCTSTSSQPGSSGECGDSVKCFWCGEKIHRWRKTDDAVIEHARLSPGCLFVIQLLGQQLHDDIVHVTSSHKQREEASRFVSPPGRQGDALSATASSKQMRRSRTVEVPSAGKQDTSQPPLTLSQVEEIMQSPAVQTVLQMGFPHHLIRDLLRYNSQHLTADTLCHLALQAAEQTTRECPGEQTSRLSPVEQTRRPSAAEHTSTAPPPCMSHLKDLNGYDQSRLTETGRTEKPYNGTDPAHSRTFTPNIVLEAPQHNVSAPVHHHPAEQPEKRVLCKVCSEAEVKVMFRPCNHLVCCRQCMSLFTLCPVCHQIIEDVLTVYLT